MPNTSATGGYLTPSAAPAPLEGQALNDFIQQWVVGITGLDGTMVRPRWQAEPPNIPTAGVAWAAIGITSRPSDTYPYVKHDPTGLGSDELQRHETLNVLVSFYDLGTNGLADQYAALLHDGTAIPQNSEALGAADMKFIACGEPVTVPSLLKQRWLYRVDLPVELRRQITRIYAVENLLSAQGTLTANDAGNGVVTRDIGVSGP